MGAIHADCVKLIIIIFTSVLSYFIRISLPSSTIGTRKQRSKVEISLTSILSQKTPARVPPTIVPLLSLSLCSFMDGVAILVLVGRPAPRQATGDMPPSQ